MTNARPGGISALSAFFVFATLMSLIAGIALLFPGSFLEPMWWLNPRARDGLSRLGPWGIVISTVSGSEPRAAIGIPIGAALVAYLWSARVREYGGRYGRG